VISFISGSSYRQDNLVYWWRWMWCISKD